MIIIFFGPPGAGKGTQAKLLANRFNVPHLSTGDILRSKLLDKDSLSDKLKLIMDSGNLVSDEILNEIIANRIINNDCKGGFILDGYPRTDAQRIFIENFFKEKNLTINNIFELKIEQRIIIERIKARSSKENRDDDKDEVIKTRILKYTQETRPLSEYYLNQYPSKYYVIDGNQEIDMIQKDILGIAKK